MMNDAIRAFPAQFLYEPEIEGDLDPKKYNRFIIAGMGGSHLAADLLQETRADLNIRIYSDYGLPVVSDQDKNQTLVILSSYSGNTAETLSAGEAALKGGLPMAAVAVGGKLLEFARANNIPYIELPNTGIQPRSAAGFSLRALMKLVGAEQDLIVSSNVSNLDAAELENQGKILAQKLQNKVPVIYAATAYRSVAYNWKIKFNETAKIPAFYNVIPELNHNEMNGFDVIDSTKALSEKFAFIFLQSNSDHSQNTARFEVLEKLYAARNFSVHKVELTGDTVYEKAAKALMLADWTAVYLSEFYGTEAEKVPMVEEFKKLIA